jgi:hypothetical protein
MSLIKKRDWIEIGNRKEVNKNDMFLLYAPDGNFAYVAGMHLEEAVKQNPNATHYYPIAEAPIISLKAE